MLQKPKDLLTKLPAIVALAAFPLLTLAQGGGSTTPERLDTFRKVDANGDGWVSKEEAAASREVAAGFEKADANRDGRLSFAEFEKLLVASRRG